MNSPIISSHRDIIFDSKDTWSYRSGGITIGGANGAWVQFGATRNVFIISTNRKPAQIKGSLLPFAKLSH